VTPKNLQNFVKINRAVFEKWGFEFLGVGWFSTLTPFRTPCIKFSGEFLGPPKRCQTPLELGQKLLPVSSYGGLNIPKIAILGANISTTPDSNFKIISAIDRASSV